MRREWKAKGKKYCLEAEVEYTRFPLFSGGKYGYRKEERASKKIYPYCAE